MIRFINGLLIFQRLSENEPKPIDNTQIPLKIPFEREKKINEATFMSIFFTLLDTHKKLMLRLIRSMAMNDK